MQLRTKSWAIAKARAKWGETLELEIIIGSWGDTFDDERMLEAIRNFNRTGGFYTKVSGLVSEARNEFAPADGDCQEIVVVPPIGRAFDEATIYAG